MRIAQLHRHRVSSRAKPERCDVRKIIGVEHGVCVVARLHDGHHLAVARHEQILSVAVVIYDVDPRAPGAYAHGADDPVHIVITPGLEIVAVGGR